MEQKIRNYCPKLGALLYMLSNNCTFFPNPAPGTHCPDFYFCYVECFKYLIFKVEFCEVFIL